MRWREDTKVSLWNTRGKMGEKDFWSVIYVQAIVKKLLLKNVNEKSVSDKNKNIALDFKRHT
jgi:hypothetical protein